MKPGESFVAQPIRSLQTMLRVIAEDDGQSPTVVPDGIYGAKTSTAVTAFQRKHGLPVTGITDQATWDAIVAVYEPALVRIGPAQPLEIIMEPGQVICRGERNYNLYIVQAILLALSQTYGSIPPSQSGVLDEATSNALSAFQQMVGLSQTGELDKQTWKALALHYPLVFNVDLRHLGSKDLCSREY